MIDHPTRAAIDTIRQEVWRGLFDRLRTFPLATEQSGEIATETSMCLDRLLVAALDTEPLPTDQPRGRLRRHSPPLPTQADLDALYNSLYNAAAFAGETEEFDQPPE